jgi:hypothetical protein
MQRRWKECEQGILLSSSAASKSSRHTAQLSSLVSPAAGARRPMMASVDAGRVKR